MTANTVRIVPSTQTPQSKTSRFRQLLADPEMAFIMEAHNGLSARIVEEVGFKGVWASGLSISAALGVRDNNEASWTQVLEVLEFTDTINVNLGTTIIVRFHVNEVVTVYPWP